jgi:hypothetical protein
LRGGNATGANPANPPRVTRLLAVLCLLASSEAHAAISVAVDPALDRRAVSPLIYGVNFGSSAEFAALPYPLRRWGGNSTTRYSWTHDAHNSGSDWYYISTASQIADPAQLPNGSEADLFVAETRAHGAEAIVTLPLIGWSPKDRNKTWGFSVAKYGAQDGTECTGSGGAWWCAADAGNGVHAGVNLAGNDPHDTSVEIGPSYAGDWIDHLKGRFGAGGVRFYAMDNEPALWNSTHRDVHPQPLSYDELWTRTLDYASAAKARDPQAQVLGPESWGWCEYFWSAVDGCSNGSDRAAHGGLGLLEWYLAQVRADQLATGVRKVDVLDVHYYPQAGTALNDDEGLAAKRLRTVKSLYDTTYVDESWIGQPVRLIPRLRQMIAARCPGLGIGISEYNFGGDDGISSALAQAEALAVFGREGVTLATRWVAPANGSRCQDAFRMYLDYDGAGGKVSGTSVRATSTKVDSIGAYAIDGSDGRLFVLLFNKHTAGETALVSVAGGGDRTGALYRLTGASAWGPAGSASLAAGALALALPARSATLLVLAPATTDVAARRAASFALRAAPNPTRAGAAIDFTLPRAGEIELALFDALGRRVRTLARGAYAEGPVHLSWDGRDARGAEAAPGVYLLRLSTQGHGETQRVLKLRGARL